MQGRTQTKPIAVTGKELLQWQSMGSIIFRKAPTQSEQVSALVEYYIVKDWTHKYMEGNQIQESKGHWRNAKCT